MSSDFDKALEAAAASQRTARQQVAAEKSAKRQSQSSALSLADPYLHQLGQQALQQIRKKGISPQRLVTQKKTFFKPEQAICWWWLSQSPPYDTDSHVNRIDLLLHENGTFYKDKKFGPGTPRHQEFEIMIPAVFQLDQVLNMGYGDSSIGLGFFDSSQTFVDPDSRKVYIITSIYPNSNRGETLDRIAKGQWAPVMELSSYVAHKVHSMSR